METQDKAAAYKALQSHDARFDGLLFVAVRSTGVYCRPICPARTPKFENCEFYSSAAAAQNAGYRPCLRCRPETAPQLAAWRGTSNTVSRAMALISDGALDGDNTGVEQLATRLGIGERQLRRLFLDHLGTSPVSVAQTRRVLLAKQLIHDTNLPMTEVAMASGFSSLRRFNEVFQDLFRRAPSALRREAGNDLAADEGEVVLHLGYLPPYDWEQMLGFFAARAIEGVEVVENGAYHRAIEVDGELGSIRIGHLPEERAISAGIRFPCLRALPAVVQRIRNMFDLETNIGLIHRHLSGDPMLAPLVARRPGLRVPGTWHGFEAAVRAVLGQQISVRAASRLASDLASACGNKLTGAQKTHERLTHVFPSAEQVRTATNLRLPMPQSRQRTLTAVAEAAASMRSPFGAGVLIAEAFEQLLATPGVGDWTAQYVALRAMRDTDAFPAGDAGLLRGAAVVFGTSGLTAKDLRQRSERWRPWRAYAAQHLWAADGELGPRRRAKGKERRMLSHRFMETRVGSLKLVGSQEALVAVLWENDDPTRVPLPASILDERHDLLLDAERQLSEYFSGTRRTFALPLEMRGTSFQRSVWNMLLTIPFGETRSYGDLARQAGNPSASRAIGAANARNPLSIVVPCHRVIGSSGKLTGFAGGLDAKRVLLDMEAGVRVPCGALNFNLPNWSQAG